MAGSNSTSRRRHCSQPVASAVYLHPCIQTAHIPVMCAVCHLLTGAVHLAALLFASLQNSSQGPAKLHAFASQPRRLPQGDCCLRPRIAWANREHSIFKKPREMDENGGECGGAGVRKRGALSQGRRRDGAEEGSRNSPAGEYP